MDALHPAHLGHDAQRLQGCADLASDTAEADDATLHGLHLHATMLGRREGRSDVVPEPLIRPRWRSERHGRGRDRREDAGYQRRDAQRGESNQTGREGSTAAKHGSPPSTAHATRPDDREHGAPGPKAWTAARGRCRLQNLHDSLPRFRAATAIPGRRGRRASRVDARRGDRDVRGARRGSPVRAPTALARCSDGARPPARASARFRILALHPVSGETR